MKFNHETYAKQMKIGLLDKFVDFMAVKKRGEMWSAVIAPRQQESYINFSEIKSVLDVGTTSDDHYESSNFFLKKLPVNLEISTFSDQEIDTTSTTLGEIDFKEKYRGSIVSEVSINEMFDLVVCSATLEHVGCRTNQKSAIDNLLKLTNKFLFITVPNRWHPIEFHARLPILHWLPTYFWRKIFRLIPNCKELSNEDNLNFISVQHIKSKLLENPRVTTIKVHRIWMVGFVSHFAILVTLVPED
jgi:hypothetical protein